jgi:hypothetical protein
VLSQLVSPLASAGRRVMSDGKFRRAYLTALI